MTYDSLKDTADHICAVLDNFHVIMQDMTQRGVHHDLAKLGPEEKPYLDAHTPYLRALTYNSPEYHARLALMQPYLDHHYARYDHHPEHIDGRCSSMSLLSLLEMLADWKAASTRHASGGLMQSFIANRKRFQIEPPLFRVLVLTAVQLGWLTLDEACLLCEELGKEIE